MEPTYKQISDEEIEVTYYTEHNQIVKKADLLASKAAIEAADTKQVDDLLAKFK